MLHTLLYFYFPSIYKVSKLMKVLIGLSAMLLPVLCCGQLASTKAVHKGSVMPATSISHILKYADSAFNTASLKNKVILFDFFTTGCLACIRELPRIDSLQQAFAGKLQVFLVTPETKAQTQAFIQRKNIAPLHLPVIYEDAILRSLFPFTYIPHEVLVQHDTVKAITFPEYITAIKIQKLLDGGVAHFPYKHDEPDFDYSAPLLRVNDESVPALSIPVSTYYSILTSYMDQVPIRYNTTMDSVANAIRISMINVPAIEMYKRVLFDARLPNAFIQISPADSSTYAYYRGTEYSKEWMQQNLYCYQGSFPIGSSTKDIQQKIAADLDFYLHLHTNREEKTLPCYVLVRDSAIHVTFHTSIVSAKRKPSGLAVSDIIFYLNGKYNSTPAINETGDSDLFIEGITKKNVQNIAYVNQRLTGYGLKLIAAERTLILLVLSGRNATQLFTHQY